MTIILGIFSIFAMGILVTMSVVFLRVLLIAGAFAAFLIWVHLIVIGIISTGVGAIIFAALFEMLGSSNAGWAWAGAISAGLLTGWTLLMMFAAKAIGWAKRFPGN